MITLDALAGFLIPGTVRERAGLALTSLARAYARSSGRLVAAWRPGKAGRKRRSAGGCGTAEVVDAGRAFAARWTILPAGWRCRLRPCRLLRPYTGQGVSGRRLARNEPGGGPARHRPPARNPSSFGERHQLRYRQSPGTNTVGDRAGARRHRKTPDMFRHKPGVNSQLTGRHAVVG